VSVAVIFMCPVILKHHENGSNACNHAVNVYALISTNSASDKIICVIIKFITLKNIKTSDRLLYACKKRERQTYRVYFVKNV
jgi:hypothetical protein